MRVGNRKRRTRPKERRANFNIVPCSARWYAKFCRALQGTSQTLPPPVNRRIIKRGPCDDTQTAAATKKRQAGSTLTRLAGSWWTPLHRAGKDEQRATGTTGTARKIDLPATETVTTVTVLCPYRRDAATELEQQNK